MKIDKKNIGGIIILGLVILISLASTLYHNWLHTLPQDYTIGTIYDIGAPAKGGTRAYYKYFVNNEKFKNSVSNYGYEDVAKVGHRFLVEYPEGRNGGGVMHLDKPAPDSIQSPVEGWDELPAFAK